MRIPPLAFMDNHLERLAAELKAIELWDEIYRFDATHREIDETSHRIRQERRREIMREMEGLAGVLDDRDRG